jgi:hypothetical protein
MAEENTATSSHLNSYMHVYDNGTTARLYVTPWNKSTVADGYWQTVNTIQPLINRDIYLADCLDKLANKYTVYKPGFGIEMEHNTVEDYWTISVKTDELLNTVPHYIFDTTYFNIDEDKEQNTVNVGFKVKPDGYIKAGDNGLFCNVEGLINETSSYSSYSSVSSKTTSSFTYEYKVSNQPFEAVSTFPSNPAPGTIYLIG